MNARLALQTTESTSFGHGFISGLLSAILGIAGFGAVLCLHFPGYLTHACDLKIADHAKITERSQP